MKENIHSQNFPRGPPIQKEQKWRISKAYLHNCLTIDILYFINSKEKSMI
jgi:hypothetical protein